eukprot:6955291-Alexandrium_andersonii.AAC.1
MRTVQGSSLHDSPESLALVRRMKQWCIAACRCENQEEHARAYKTLSDDSPCDDASLAVLPTTREDFLTLLGAMRSTGAASSSSTHGISAAGAASPSGFRGKVRGGEQQDSARR